MDISRLEELLDEGINGDSTKVLSQPRAEKSDKRGSVDGLFDSLDQETTVTETEPPASSDDKVQSCEAEPFKTTSKACKKQQSSKLFFAVVLAAFAIEFVGRFVSTNHFNRNFSLSVAELERLGELPASIALSDLTPHPALDVAPLSSGAASWSAVVIKPMEGRDLISFAELQKWAARNADKLSKGAAVFRGFPYLAKNPQGFEEFAGNFAEDLQDIYLGTSPRLPVAGTKSVFTSAEFDRKVPIPDHAEMSFLPKPPRILLFNCFEIENGAGSLPGGETALIDYAELWAAMDPKVRSRLADKGLRYTRRYPHKKNWPMLDPRFMKSWNSMFGDKKEDAKVASHEQGFNVTWGGEDMLTLTNNGPAFRVHPVTGIPTFHAHIHGEEAPSPRLSCSVEAYTRFCLCLLCVCPRLHFLRILLAAQNTFLRNPVIWGGGLVFLCI